MFLVYNGTLPKGIIMLVNLLSKLPTSALIRILLAYRKIMSATATHYKNRANKKLSEYKSSYHLHLLMVAMYKDLNIQKLIEKPKFVQEIEADLETAKYYEGWIRKIDETIRDLEVADSLNAK